MPKDTMHSAYRVAGELIKDRLKEQDPDSLRELEGIKDADVIITRGQYDHIENVFKHGHTPCTTIESADIDDVDLRVDQIVMVNCPGNFSKQGLRKLHGFVNDGGFLFTTDWALRNVLETAFPGFVEYTGSATGDEVVRVEVIDKDDPFLSSILGPKDDPQWWLEGSSYPIRVLQKDRVQILLSSKALGDKYAEPAVFVTFEVGQGRIYHMISHFYLQRTETRTERHKGTAYDYLAEKGVGRAEFAKYAALGADGAALGAVESALTSRTMMSRVMYEKKMQIRRGLGKKKGKENGEKKV